MSEPILRLENVTQTFQSPTGSVTALSGLSLQVRKGEIVSLLGASGCGKSTVLNLAAGFMEPTSGQVLFHGRPIDGVEPRCGMVFQSYALFPWKTVRQNIEFGPALGGVNKGRRRSRAQRFIELVGLAGFEDAYPEQLSGGMKQRVALARTLANEAEVLLCDEPFAALDALTRQQMQDELLRIVQVSGQTVLFVTHSIDEALILSDRVAVMSARPGRIRMNIDNKLHRPRRVDVQLSEGYLQLKKKVWSAVEDEVRRS